MNNIQSNASSLVRLNKFLAQCGMGSRRRCDALIAAGRILVNGRKVIRLGTKIDPACDVVEEKRSGRVAPVRRLEYFAFNKPRRCVVTRIDPQGRETIYDILRRGNVDATHLRYVGRLDYDSEGLLILTNDGSLIHALTHPRFHIKKTYMVGLSGSLSEADAGRIVAEGVVSEGQVLRAGDIRSCPRDGFKTTWWYEVDLYEGKKRQIRRMFAALGYEVVRLRRIAFGLVRLGKLASGAIRPLTEREISGLKNVGYRS